jgi:hypothetical protein
VLLLHGEAPLLEQVCARATLAAGECAALVLLLLLLLLLHRWRCCWSARWRTRHSSWTQWCAGEKSA